MKLRFINTHNYSMDDDTQNSETEIGLKGLKWQAFLVDSWFTMCDSQLLEM